MNTTPSLLPDGPDDRNPDDTARVRRDTSPTGRVGRPAPRRALFGIALLALLSGQGALADVECDGLIVVVNVAAGVERLDAREVRKLFLGKSRRLPGGARAVLASFEPITSRFNARVLGRSDAQVTAAWSRLKFSGRVRPPHAFESIESIVDFVADTPNAIAYLPACDVGEGVRTVHVVEP